MDRLFKITGTTVETIIDTDPPPVYNIPNGSVSGSGAPVNLGSDTSTPSPPNSGSNGGGNNSSDVDVISLEDFLDTFPEDALGGEIPPGTVIVYPPSDDPITIGL